MEGTSNHAQGMGIIILRQDFGTQANVLFIYITSFFITGIDMVNVLPAPS